ncbi:hypothetical protein ACHAXA_011196 [Cyclostephanos tholiformis]|uniref:Protein kinase domain-containing protein n=1 Tax=Cyclostephanos tholiformis TaxID=382380 RepID=A0ABD3R0A1_9STRA
MGQCTSTRSPYIASSSGGEREYLERYHESTVLGRGEFGLVRLIHDVRSDNYLCDRPLAVKYLRKGFQFRDNTIYSPLRREVLAGEVEILRRLDGQCYTLRLVDVYESSSTIYLITEYCEGGEMLPWVSNAFGDSVGGLRTEDVSRISYQLWSAVDHCARHGVIHRDIKPANVMFCTADKDSQLRLIDFGSGTLDGMEGGPGKTDDTTSSSDVHRHHTFAGSAFYISPEMFQHDYTTKTDVWSAGTTLYVMAAGYPADALQETFDVLQGSRPGRLRNLPNLPKNMPDSFYDMLEGALVYRQEKRKDARQLMHCEFSQFHIQHDQEGHGTTTPGILSIAEIIAEAGCGGGEFANDDDSADISPDGRTLNKSTTSVVLEGSVNRHNAYLGYQIFERSVTTILATMLAKDTSRRFLSLLREQHDAACPESTPSHANKLKLQVVTIKALLELLGGMPVRNGGAAMEVKRSIEMIQSLANFSFYQNFAYHISLLRQFVSKTSSPNNNDDDDSIKRFSSVHGNNVWSTLKSRRGLDNSRGKGTGGSGVGGDGGDLSIKSVGGGMRRIVSATGILSSMK